uniref:Factor of DNA methylation 4-like B n=1 Tax=Hypericum perforatum TaxID=65561 RepID=A0A4Y5U3V5_HYPPE|nr:factor of DNA methylation 4-like B [Hypericum perforatum]
MSRHGKEDADSYYRELEDFEYRYYKDLKDGTRKVQAVGAKYYCPFCNGKKDYTFQKLLEHATEIGSSRKSDLKEKARHLALKNYVKKYLTPEDKPLPSVKDDDLPLPSDKDPQFCWPPVGIVANIPTELNNGRRVAASGSRFRDELTMKGFEPVRVTPLWNHMGHSGFAAVEFKGDWDGFSNAMKFEKDFEVKRCGKKDYFSLSVVNRGDKLYGWVAKDDDYRSRNVIGKFLSKRDLKSVSLREAELRRRSSMLVSNLKGSLHQKDDRLKEIKSKYSETSASVRNLMNQKDKLIQYYNDEMKKMQQAAHDYFQTVSAEHEKARQNLEAQKRELEEQEAQLQQRENESERRRLDNEKKTNELATQEQKMAEERMSKLADEQKKEKEQLHERILLLERTLDEKQALELEIQSLKGSLDVMKHMAEDGDITLKKKMEAIQEEMKEKQENYDALDELNTVLMIRERKTNDELQEVRKELIQGFSGFKARPDIGIKRMGELDGTPFHAVAKTKFSDEDKANEWAATMISAWEEHLRDQSWHPFKVLQDEGGRCKACFIIPFMPKPLKINCGDEVYYAVTRALMEMNEYNPSGRYIVRELWNFEQNRKARLNEVMELLLQFWKKVKKRRARY